MSCVGFLFVVTVGVIGFFLVMASTVSIAMCAFSAVRVEKLFRVAPFVLFAGRSQHGGYGKENSGNLGLHG